jgi:hypothetical protein
MAENAITSRSAYRLSKIFFDDEGKVRSLPRCGVNLENLGFRRGFRRRRIVSGRSDAGNSTVGGSVLSAPQG